MKLSDFLAVSFSAIIISFLATLYPARQAAKLNPVEPLRYE
jgi:lipoprotein-releasing system permease protein